MLPDEATAASEAAARAAAGSIGRSGGPARSGGRDPNSRRCGGRGAQIFSRPHQDAMKSAIEPVTRRIEARLTRSSKPWTFSARGP